MGGQPIPGSWTTVSVTANGNTVDISGLNGDSDASYDIDIRLNVANPGVIDVRPNASTSNLRSGSVNSTGAAVAAFGGAASSQIAGSAGTGEVSGRMVVSAISGRFREFFFNGFDQTNNSGIMASVQWQDTTTILTSIRIQAANASSILSGSFVRWRITG